jgi:hypothetical protein
MQESSLKSSAALVIEKTTPPPPNPSQEAVTEILRVYGKGRDDLINDYHGDLRLNIVSWLIESGLFEARRDSEQFVEMMLSAVKGGALSAQMEQWLKDTSAVVSQIGRLRDQRTKAQAWHRKKEDLERKVAAAEDRLQYECGRLKCGWPNNLKAALVEDYIGAVAGNRHIAPDSGRRFVQNYLIDVEYVRLLREDVIPLLEATVVEAKRTLAEFISGGGQR